MLMHATAIALGGSAVLLVGPPGSGKSDLALRLIDRGALLVADDQVWIQAADGGLVATAPANLAGLLEVRGLGIVRLPFLESAKILLVADLAALAERLPLPSHQHIAGVDVPRLAFAAFEHSAPLKLERAVALARISGLWSADGEA